MKLRNVIHTFFRDTNGKVVLWQAPNPILWVVIVAAAVSRLTNGRIHDDANLIFFGSIFTWAWLEISSGVTYFRRALGAGVLLVVLWSRL